MFFEGALQEAFLWEIYKTFKTVVFLNIPWKIYVVIFLEAFNW